MNRIAGSLPDTPARTATPMRIGAAVPCGKDPEYGQLPALLPVLDVLAGQVVHARGGRRDEYAPIQSSLVAGSAPKTVLAALLLRTAAQRVYLADLDAILGGPPQYGPVSELLHGFPAIDLWFDAGFRSRLHACHALEEAGLEATALARLVPVLGTESLVQIEDLSSSGGACVLSLDFGPEGFRGDPAWLETPGAWPDRVIVMSLSRVGADCGPDLARLRWCRERAGQREVFAAGGVSTPADLDALHALRVTGALVASALHFGTLAGPPAAA